MILKTTFPKKHIHKKQLSIYQLFIFILIFIFFNHSTSLLYLACKSFTKIETGLDGDLKYFYTRLKEYILVAFCVINYIN